MRKGSGWTSPPGAATQTMLPSGPSCATPAAPATRAPPPKERSVVPRGPTCSDMHAGQEVRSADSQWSPDTTTQGTESWSYKPPRRGLH
eukprot:6813656-Pyramimonas_sp.AAC.1